MRLSEIKQLVGERGIRLTKSLGQNFLHDGNQLRRIVEAAGLTERDRALEIGPGLGPLTELLLGRAGEVLAIEKDARLVEVLRERFAPEIERHSQGRGGLGLVHADALDFLRGPAGARGEADRDWTGWKLVANLPYSVASPILVELAQAARGPDLMVATLQIEVARRLCAAPGDADYGLLTLLVQGAYEPGGWFKIPASCFWPAPDVDSACVTLARRPVPAFASDREVFVRVVKRAFSQRRKMALKLLKEEWPADLCEAAFRKLGLAETARAEEISLGQFAALAGLVRGEPAVRARGGSEEVFDVVNERDEVVGRNTRSEVHRLGLMHRAVHVLVFDSAGRIFLQKRSMKKDRQPGLWDSSASGHVDAGENYDACAVRELAEELGMRAAGPLERLFKLAASAETDQEHVWVYRCRGDGPFSLDPEEIERGDWFDPGELNRWLEGRPGDFAGGFRAIWKRLKEAQAP